MNCWVMKMKHGARGDDYSQELWEKDRVGIMYGSWSCDGYSNLGEPTSDEIFNLVNGSYLHCIGDCQVQTCKVSWPGQIRLFFDSMQLGDLVAVSLEKNQRPVLGIAKLGQLVNGQKIDCHERLKCRELSKKKVFELNQLPPALMLLRQMPYKQAVQCLTSADGQYTAISHLMINLYGNKANTPPDPMDLGYLHPSQWEILCGEYLRAEKAFSPLLGIGGTLKHFDLMGRNKKGESIVAQCKNSSNPWPRHSEKGVYQWEKHAASFSHKYFFSRGGFSGQVRPESSVIEITGKDIDAWLNTDKGEIMRKRLPLFTLPFDLRVR